ncbi:MAG: DUF6056 family protein [Suilimivivens sp.]
MIDNLGIALSKWVTPKRLSLFLTVIYLLSLVPLLWIGYYNYPSADDYSIGSDCRQAWVSTHSIWATVFAGIIRAVEDWKDWMGYYTSNFLMAMPPSTFGERAYVLTSWIMLGMLSFSTVYLLRAIFVKVFQADKYAANCVSMLMLFVTVQRMQGRVEAFYWYSGAANYILVHSFCLLFYGLLISAVYDKGKKRIFDLVMASILGFLTGGGNQMTALNGAIVLLVAIVFVLNKKKWKEYKPLAVPMGFYYLGFILNVAAPGNWVRAEGASGMNPVKAILVSFYYCLDYCLGKWSGWPVLLLVIVLIPLFWKMTEKCSFSFSYPLVVVLFGFCLVSAMMTPPLFAVGNMEAARLQALTYAMYILVLTLCVGYVTGWARRKAEAVFEQRNKADAMQEEKCFSRDEIWCILGCLVFFAMASLITIIPEPHYFTFSSAMTDLVSGSAKAYGDALEERMKLYHSGEKDIVVEPLPSQPALLYFSDIKEDPEDWENKGLCRFYGIDSVRVKE